MKRQVGIRYVSLTVNRYTYLSVASSIFEDVVSKLPATVLSEGLSPEAVSVVVNDEIFGVSVSAELSEFVEEPGPPVGSGSSDKLELLGDSRLVLSVIQKY